MEGRNVGTIGGGGSKQDLTSAKDLPIELPGTEINVYGSPTTITRNE